MEGNDCYKFSTIRNFIAGSPAKDVETIVEIGANIGEVTLLMHGYFPAARIIAFEAVKEYCDIAAARTRKIPNVAIHNQAVTAQHRFLDDLGEQRRGEDIDLVILKGLPDGGPGWVGGSMVFPRDNARVADPDDHYGYLKIDQAVTPITLAEIMQREDLAEVDILKLDCEGCEHSVLGTAGPDLLKRIRFIVGEYHGFDRFAAVMRNRLFQTHKVNIIGDPELGAFFAERFDERGDGILHDHRVQVPVPWQSHRPSEWHAFNERYVLPEERYWHGLP
jgi:Methyltransferase FkbM domain